MTIEQSINKLAESMELLAHAILQTRDTAPAPIELVQTVQTPIKPEPSRVSGEELFQPQPDPEPDPEPESQKDLTVDDLIDTVKVFATVYGKTATEKLLKNFDVARVSKIPQERWHEFVDTANSWGGKV